MFKKQNNLFLLTIMIFLSIGTKYESKDDIKSIHFLFLADVSGSMKESYDNNELEVKSGKIYDLFEDITNKLSSKNKNKLQVSGILFGTQKGEIADLISLTDLACQTFNFPKIYNAKESLINLLENHGAVTIKEFMYKEDISPTEEECNFFYNILKDDYYFTKKVVESLPYQCKDKYYKYEKTGAKVAVGALGEFVVSSIITVNPVIGLAAAAAASYYSYKKTDEYISNSEDTQIINEIKEQLKKCITHKLNGPLDKFNWYKNDFELKPAKEVLNSLKFLKEKIPLRKNNNIMNSFSNYIYSNTPLKKAMSKAIEISKKDEKETIKILVILSDGYSTDGDPNDLKHLIDKENTYIITCYFSSEKVYKPKKLYSQNPYENQGIKQLYDLASDINPYSPIFDMLEQRGWEVDYTQKSKLFIKANSMDIFDEFFTALNSFINGNNILGDMLSKIKMNDYITFYNKAHRISENQIGPICWCHSLAKIIEYGSHRIYRGKYLEKYPYPVFSDLRDLLINKYNNKGKTDFQMRKILDEILPKYFLRYSYYSNIQESKIKLALMRGRPLVLTFDLSAMQWKNFGDFFRKSKKGIITNEILNKKIPEYLYKDETSDGHAVILIDHDDDSFICLNSWGKNWGDNGKFRIKDLNILVNPAIFDVYFYESDLPYELKQEWYKYSKKNEKTFKDKYFDIDD